LLAIARHARQIKNLFNYELLEYHRLGESKYTQLGRGYPFAKVSPPDSQRMSRLKEMVAAEVGRAG